MHADVTMLHTDMEAVWPQSLYGNCREMFDEVKFLWQQLNISWGLCKFRDKDGNCMRTDTAGGGRHTEGRRAFQRAGRQVEAPSTCTKT